MWDDLLKLQNWHDIIMKIQKKYGMVIQKFRLQNAGVSCIFYLTTPKYQAYYVCFTHPKFHSLEAVNQACEFQNYLHYHSAYVPTIRLTIEKECAFSIEVEKQSYAVSIVSAAYGDSVSFEDDNEEMWSAVGESIAKMHLAASRYDKAPDFISWQDLWNETLKNRKYIPSGFDESQFSLIEDTLQALEKDKEDYGIIHADCRPGNFIFDGERITIIDFDEPTYHWYAADIARTLIEFYELGDERKAQSSRAVLKGYHAVKPITQSICTRLPYFMRMKDMELYTWCKKMGKDLPETSLSLKKVENRLLDKNWYKKWQFLTDCL